MKDLFLNPLVIIGCIGMEEQILDPKQTSLCNMLSLLVIIHYASIASSLQCQKAPH
jgi:hypothetical protein